MFFGVLTAYITDGPEIQAKGFLFGYTNMVWAAIAVQSAGGLIVAMVIKHADNILKGFATSSAIVLSCIVSMALFDFQLTFLFALGSSLVIFSIFLYSKPELIKYIPFISTYFEDRSGSLWSNRTQCWSSSSILIYSWQSHRSELNDGISMHQQYSLQKVEYSCARHFSLVVSFFFFSLRLSQMW